MMAAAGSLRRSSRPTMEPLVWAFAISICAHLIAYGGYELGRRLHWWEKDLLPAWLRKATQVLMMERKQPKPAITAAQQQIPLLFVEVDPSTVTSDAPAHATHYSSQNTKAANPDAHLDMDVPKIAGTQTHVQKTESTPRSKAMPLQPAPKEEQAESKPQGGQKVGDLAMAKPVPKPADNPKEGDKDAAAAVETHKRPRTLAEAKARQMIPGEMMKQEGGVRRERVASSLDAIGTPFGEYDREVINAITSHWYALLDEGGPVMDHPGEVMLQFRLHYDGRVTDMKVIKTTVNELMTYQCQRAIIDPAPYKPWPIEMRRLMEDDSRELLFTFFFGDG